MFLWFRIIIIIMSNFLFQQAIEQIPDLVSFVVQPAASFHWRFRFLGFFFCSFSKALVVRMEWLSTAHIFCLILFGSWRGYQRNILRASVHYHNYIYDIQLNTWILIIIKICLTRISHTNTRMHSQSISQWSDEHAPHTLVITLYFLRPRNPHTNSTLRPRSMTPTRPPKSKKKIKKCRYHKREW